MKIRHHGDRTSVAVEGDNFWFCYNVTVSCHSRRLPSQEITGSSIQFDGLQHKTSTVTEDRKVHVSLQSHFFKNVNQEVQVDEKVRARIIIYVCCVVLTAIFFVIEIRHFHSSEAASPVDSLSADRVDIPVCAARAASMWHV